MAIDTEEADKVLAEVRRSLETAAARVSDPRLNSVSTHATAGAALGPIQEDISKCLNRVRQLRIFLRDLPAHEREATKTKTIHLGSSDHETSEVLGVTVSRGYLLWVRPDSANAIDNSIEHTDGKTGETFTEPRNWGYHGNDVPPCQGEYVADEESSGGYLVIYGEPEIECVDGWTAGPADLDFGWSYADGSGYHVVVLRRHWPQQHEYTICGSIDC